MVLIDLTRLELKIGNTVHDDHHFREDARGMGSGGRLRVMKDGRPPGRPMFEHAQ